MHKSDINAEWIEKVLHQQGLLPAASRITGIAAAPIGTGQVADSVRVELTVDGETPFHSLVAKASSDDENSRAAGRTELRSESPDDRRTSFPRTRLLHPRRPRRVPARHAR